MADTLTPNYKWVQPTVGGDSTTWGGIWNSNLAAIDAQVFANETKINAAAAVVQGPNNIVISGQTSGSTRWQIIPGNGASETGGNVGSDFALAAFSDSGAYLSEPIQITRATGLVEMPGAVNAGSLSTATLNATNATVGNNAVVYGTLTVGGAATLNSTLNVGGVADFNSNMGISGTLGVNGAATFNSTFSAAGGVYGADFFVNGTSTYLGNSILQFQSGWTLTCNGGSFFFNSPQLPAGNSALELDGDGALGIGGQAYKPGGGPWGDSSDARIKTVERGYELGLNEILELRPVVYRYRGNDAAPGKASKRPRDRSFVGLVAQEVERVFPGMVTKRKGFVDGREVDDLRDLDTTELIFALVNAVQTLAAEVAELKAR
jgi:hypothetical protein